MGCDGGVALRAAVAAAMWGRWRAARLIPQIQTSFLSKDVDAMQPHMRAFVQRAVVFAVCPECGGTRLSGANLRRVGNRLMDSEPNGPSTDVHES